MFALEERKEKYGVNPGRMIIIKPKGKKKSKYVLEGGKRYWISNFEKESLQSINKS